MAENEKKPNTELIVFAILGFLGLDKFYRKQPQMGWIKILVVLILPNVIWLKQIFFLFGWLGSVLSLIAFAWYVVDIVFAIIDKYQDNPLDYFR